MLTLKDEKQSSVSKIAIVNPYLQGGHLLIAESETAARFVQAGKNLSIDIQIFASINDVKDFDPDFVINITYQEGKLSNYPTYVSLNIPIFFLKDVPRFVRNILTCDGFLTVSPSVVNWLNKLCAKHNKQPFISHTAFSVPKTEFVTCNFKNALAMYIGTNWDGMRHQGIFNYLSEGDYLKCFGPRSSWQNYLPSLYGGEIPFDGTSAFNTYRHYAAGLCIGHPEFDSAGIANTRIFEIAAASALPICLNNELTKNIYHDSVLYLDENLSTENLAGQIKAFVQWIRNNSNLAQEMAREAHACFNKNASMEFYIKNLVEMHEKAMRGNGFIADVENLHLPSRNDHAIEKIKVVYLLIAQSLHSGMEDIVRDINSQTCANISIVILSKHHPIEVTEFIKKMRCNTLDIYPMTYEGLASNNQLLNYLKTNNVDWVGVVTCGDRIFKNHTVTLLNKFCENKNNKINGIFSGCLEHDNNILPELICDDHSITYHNNSRIKYVKFDENVPWVSLLINTHSLENTLLNRHSLYELKNVKLFNQFFKKNKILECSSVTCSVRVSPENNEMYPLPLWRSISFLRKMMNRCRNFI